MTDAPKIDTKAPDMIHAAGERLLVEIDMLRDIAGTPDASSICDELHQWVRARIDDRLASAAREAAAVERAFRDGLTYGTICEVTDQDEAWRTSQARERLGDPAALDRLIAERVREAVEAERTRIADEITQRRMLLHQQLEVLDISREDAVYKICAEVARGSKEGQS